MTARGYNMSMDGKPLPADLAGTLDERSREIFRALVESYMESGDPLGSRSLSRMLPMSLSPASKSLTNRDQSGISA